MKISTDAIRNAAQINQLRDDVDSWWFDAVGDFLTWCQVVDPYFPKVKYHGATRDEKMINRAMVGELKRHLDGLFLQFGPGPESSVRMAQFLNLTDPFSQCCVTNNSAVQWNRVKEGRPRARVFSLVAPLAVSTPTNRETPARLLEARLASWGQRSISIPRGRIRFRDHQAQVEISVLPRPLRERIKPYAISAEDAHADLLRRFPQSQTFLIAGTADGIARMTRRSCRSIERKDHAVRWRGFWVAPEAAARRCRRDNALRRERLSKQPSK